MKKEQFPDKYSEILNELKREKMDWDFDDFLEKTETSSKQPLKRTNLKVTKKASYFWMAASSVVLLGLFFALKFFGNPSVEANNELVKNEILSQKKSGALKDTLEIGSSTIAVLDSVENKEKNNDFISLQPSNEIMTDRILSDKERLRKKIPIRYVNRSESQKMNNSNVASDSGLSYRENYVMVNGRYIQNEDEALEITKKAFKIVGRGMSEAIDETKVIAKMNIEL